MKHWNKNKAKQTDIALGKLNDDLAELSGVILMPLREMIVVIKDSL